MSTWGLIQIILDIFFALGLFIVVMRLQRQPKDDPRLSRGLQLLQAKISVLEDLSDRTESQVQQMTLLLEQKAREVQNKIQLADRHVQLVRSAMDRSLEVARIFQDKIPHQEIIERQNTLKYLTAARLAHQGKSLEEIAQTVDLPKGEIEFIAKVNREQLMFSEDQLPDWARAADPTLGFSNEVEETEAETPVVDASEAHRQAASETARLSRLANQQELVEGLQQVQREMDEMLRTESVRRDFSDVFSVPRPPVESLARLGEEFRRAKTEAEGGATMGAQLNGLSFVELHPETGSVSSAGSAVAPASPSAAGTFVVAPGDVTDDNPLLDLSYEEIEALKRSIAMDAGVHSSAGSAAPEATSPELSPSATVAATLDRPTTAVASPTTGAASAPTPSSALDPRTQALAQARAAAQEINRPRPKSTVSGATAPTVRKVVFPRIKSGEDLG